MERIGEYRVERQLAKTRAFVEYHAIHAVLPRRAVLKVATQPSTVEVLREACLLEALQHPGIVRVFESGLLPDRRPWFARELIEGATIASTLAPGAIDRSDIIALLRDLAEVLTHAHQRGVIHTNLRPDRIVTSGRTREFPACITDWSDARAHDAAAGAPIVDSVASWYYMAPEVVAGDVIDDRADVFSLGVLAYRLLTGTLPFEGTVARTAEGITQHVPTEVRCPGAPRELTSMVDQMLALDRWDRPSAAEVVTELTLLVTSMAAPPPRDPSAVFGRVRQPRWTPAFEMSSADNGAIGSLLSLLDGDDALDRE